MILSNFLKHYKFVERSRRKKRLIDYFHRFNWKNFEMQEMYYVGNMKKISPIVNNVIYPSLWLGENNIVVSVFTNTFNSLHILFFRSLWFVWFSSWILIIYLSFQEKFFAKNVWIKPFTVVQINVHHVSVMFVTHYWTKHLNRILPMFPQMIVDFVYDIDCQPCFKETKIKAWTGIMLWSSLSLSRARA